MRLDWERELEEVYQMEIGLTKLDCPECILVDLGRLSGRLLYERNQFQEWVVCIDSIGNIFEPNTSGGSRQGHRRVRWVVERRRSIQT